MANLGQLVVNLEANIARFTQDMQRASQQTEQAMTRIQSAADKAKTVLGAIGVALSVDVIMGEINRTLDGLAALDDMAQKTGSSVETLSKLSKVAAFTGTDLGAVDGMLVKLSKNLNDVDDKSNKTAKALATIGISTKDLKDQDPAQVFVQIANKLQGYEDGAGKVALVTDLMGKSAADMLPYMNDVAESLDKFSGDSAEAAAAAAAYQDQLGLMRLKYDELVTSIVTDALPAANDFIAALQDTYRESSNLTNGTNVDGWADDVALGLARVVDVARLIPSILKTVAGSFRAVGADIEFVGTMAYNVMPANLVNSIRDGAFQAALDKREAVVAESNKNLEDLWNKPANQMEQAVLARIAGRQSAVAPAEVPTVQAALAYSSGDSKDNKEKNKDKEWSRAAAADRMVKLALDETLALRNTEKVTEDLIESETRRMEQKARAAERITLDAENIRQSLMTDVEHEQFAYEARVQQLQAFGALKLENEIAANALIEAETERHARAKADIEAAQQSQMLGMAGDSADQLYSLMQQAGMEKTALGKALFMANKAIAVAEIIQSTEVAAAKALEMGPIAGPILSGIVRGMGYASAGIVIGQTIASAEGGYDIPAGVNPVTQLHEKEMVLPKAQAEVIRGLAANGGAGGGMKVTIVNQTTGRIDNVIEQRISPTERALIIQEAVAATASTLGDPNSKTSRAMSRNFNVARTRS